MKTRAGTTKAATTKAATTKAATTKAAAAKKAIAAAAATAAIATGTFGAAAIAAPTAVAVTRTAPSGTLAVAVVATVQAAALQPWPMLREGQNSTWPKVTVRSLQYLLKAHGAQITVDGAFGQKTKAAVVAFQLAHHVRGDGVVGRVTWRALLVTVKLGSTGQAVRAVQDQANFRNNKNGHTLNVDGVFGPATRAWVRAFQQAIAHDVRGFPVDGIVGPQTWQALVTEALSG